MDRQTYTARQRGLFKVRGGNVRRVTKKSKAGSICVYRVGQIELGQFTFLLVTRERIYNTK